LKLINSCAHILLKIDEKSSLTNGFNMTQLWFLKVAYFMGHPIQSSRMCRRRRRTLHGETFWRHTVCTYCKQALFSSLAVAAPLWLMLSPKRRKYFTLIFTHFHGTLSVFTCIFSTLHRSTAAGSCNSCGLQISGAINMAL